MLLEDELCLLSVGRYASTLLIQASSLRTRNLAWMDLFYNPTVNPSAFISKEIIHKGVHSNSLQQKRLIYITTRADMIKYSSPLIHEMLFFKTIVNGHLKLE